MNYLTGRWLATKNGYPGGDFLVALVLVGIVFYVSWFVDRRKSRRSTQ